MNMESLLNGILHRANTVKKIRKLTRHHRWYPVASAMQCYHVGLMTWEQARAELGIKSDPNDPRWGRFFVPWDSPKRKENND